MRNEWQPGATIFRWPVNNTGYEIRRLSKKEIADIAMPARGRELAEKGQRYIVPKAGKDRWYEAVLGQSSIFVDLLNAPPTDAGIQGFVNKWGSNWRLRPCSRDSFLRVRKLVLQLYENGERLLQANCTAAEADKYAGTVGSASLKFLPPINNPEGPVTLCWSVLSLMDYLRLEVITDMGASSRTARCEICSNFFARPARKGPAPEHCSNACKQKAYRRRQALVSDV